MNDYLKYKKFSPDEFDLNSKTYPMIEEIYAPKRTIPGESAFTWNKEIKENELLFYDQCSNSFPG